jgi:transposase-like protein
MAEHRKKYDQEFRGGAVRIVEESGKPIAQVARSRTAPRRSSTLDRGHSRLDRVSAARMRARARSGA